VGAGGGIKSSKTESENQMNWAVNETWMIVWLSFMLFASLRYPPQQSKPFEAILGVGGVLVAGLAINLMFNGVVFGVQSLGYEIGFNIRSVK